MEDTNLQDEDEQKKPQVEGDADLGLDDVSGDTELNFGGSGIETETDTTNEGSQE